VNVWIDIDNPPQVQYMTAFIPAFERRGCRVLVTARDYQMTHQLLCDRGISHRLIGQELGASKLRKWRGTLRRSARLALTHRGGPRPDLLVSMARSAAITSWGLRLPAFTVIDYEFQELRSFGAAGVTVLHPEVIRADAFAAAGVARERLVPFSGIKEDLTFSQVDVDGTAPHDFGVDRSDATLVLVRPPSEISTYASSASSEFNAEVLRRLAARPELQVVFSPRHQSQVASVRAIGFKRAPIILDTPIEFVSLLKGVDWVLCGGGTMLREAAYIGVPAVSTFRSKLGAVDAWLESIGAVRMLKTPADIDEIPWATPPPAGAVRRNPQLVESLADLVLSRVR
jgi:predicted glycosyltransferase